MMRGAAAELGHQNEKMLDMKFANSKAALISSDMETAREVATALGTYAGKIASCVRRLGADHSHAVRHKSMVFRVRLSIASSRMKRLQRLQRPSLMTKGWRSGLMPALTYGVEINNLLSRHWGR